MDVEMCRYELEFIDGRMECEEIEIRDSGSLEPR